MNTNRLTYAVNLGIVGLCSVLLLTASGCQTLGPDAVRAGRLSYNQAIQDTSKEQLFLNFIHVHNHDTTLFLEVTEVDAQLSINSSITGSAGASATLGTSSSSKTKTHSSVNTGTIGGTMSYADSPTIRYQPLQGQPLIAQTTTPISVDSLAQLYDSDWPIGPVLDMTSDRLAPDFNESYSALNAIMQLDDYGAITLAAVRSDLSSRPTSRPDSAAGSPAGPTSGPNDALAIYLEPEHIYAEVYPDQTPEESRKQMFLLWRRLLRIYHYNLGEDVDVDHLTDDQLPHEIELRSAPVMRSSGEMISATGRRFDAGPSLRTRSAMGILMRGLGEGGFIEVVSRDKFEDITNRPENKKRGLFSGNFYMLRLLGDSPRAQTMRQWLATTKQYNTVRADEDLSNSEQLFQENLLGFARRYMLIIESDEAPPEDAYVSTSYHDKWYYIDGKDVISQKNFVLIAQMLSMQAIPTYSPPLTPTISVGGH